MTTRGRERSAAAVLCGALAAAGCASASKIPDQEVADVELAIRAAERDGHAARQGAPRPGAVRPLVGPERAREGARCARPRAPRGGALGGVRGREPGEIRPGARGADRAPARAGRLRAPHPRVQRAEAPGRAAMSSPPEPPPVPSAPSRGPRPSSSFSRPARPQVPNRWSPTRASRSRTPRAPAPRKERPTFSPPRTRTSRRRERLQGLARHRRGRPLCAPRGDRGPRRATARSAPGARGPGGGHAAPRRARGRRARRRDPGARGARADGRRAARPPRRRSRARSASGRRPPRRRAPPSSRRAPPSSRWRTRAFAHSRRRSRSSVPARTRPGAPPSRRRPRKSQADLLAQLQAIERSARMESRGIVLTLPGSVYFDTGRADVKAGRPSAVARIAEACAARRTASSRGGPTDSTGSAATNERLSEQRAEAVKSILVAHGVRPDRVETHGYAATRPVATNASGRADENRRVEIVVQGAARWRRR